MKGIWEIFVLFLQLFFMSAIISKLKIKKKKNFYHRIVYSEIVSFKNEVVMKTF